MIACLKMIMANHNLVQDCDNERKTPLHWACHNDSNEMVQILVDFGAQITAKDDYARKPIDELISTL